MTVRVTLDKVEMDPKWAAETARLGAENVAKRARQLVPRRSNELAQSIRTRVLRHGNSYMGEVEATAPHALFVHDGTGLWGPRHDYIRPRRAKMLHWVDYGGAHVYASKVRGVPPRPFLVWALQDELEGVAKLTYVRPYTRTRYTPSGPRVSQVRAHVRRKK